MRSRASIEWTAFTGGLAIALAVWVIWHQPQADRQNRFHASVFISEDTWADKSVPNNTGFAAYNSVGSGSIHSTTASQNGAKTAQRARQHTAASDSIPQNPATTSTTAAASTAALPDAFRSVRVYLTRSGRIETVPLETYVRGVVAAEMPAEKFEPAALEAQALAARTYIVRRLLAKDRSGMPAPDADVTDTQTHQAYLPLDEMDRLRKENEPAWRKADDAVKRTKGLVIAYNGEPIQALYFSSANGYTENSEDVFDAKLPYLRSVSSPWDLTVSPNAKETTVLPLDEFYDKLGIRTFPAVARLTGYPKINITARTTGKRVKTVTIGGKTLSGTEIRDKLGLRSAAFTWSVHNGRIAITTYGSGHGVGMSQWGAEAMARIGSTAEQIVKHYYSGAEIMEVSKLAETLRE